jgi:hypothetical protein
MAGGMHPQLQQALNLLGCNGPNRKYGGNTKDKDKYGGNTNDKYGVSTTPGYNNNNDEDGDNQEDASDNQNDDADDGGNLQSGIPPEKKSKIQQLLSIARGEKGAKRNFIKGLFGLNKKDKTFKQGHKLPSSSYKLDKDDANSLKNLEKEIEDHNNSYN